MEEISKQEEKGKSKKIKRPGKKLTKKQIAALVILAIVVVLVVVNVVNGKKKDTTGQDTGSTVEDIEQRTIVNSISGSGTVVAANSQDITADVAGMKVATVNVAEGDIVSVGDIICTMDTSDLQQQMTDLQKRIDDTKADQVTQDQDYDTRKSDSQASTQKQLTTARENLAKAQTDMEDYQNKYDTTGNPTYLNMIQTQKSRIESYQSQIENLEDQDTTDIDDARKNYDDQIKSTLDSYDDQMETYQEQMGNSVVKATMAGTVTTLNVEVNSNYNGGTIAVIEGVDAFIIEAQIDEYDVADVATGMKVLMKTDATRDEELTGVVTYVAPKATSSGGSSYGDLSSLIGMDMGSMSSSSSSGSSATYLVRISLDAQNARLRLGMNAKISIVTEEAKDVWSVPYEAVYEAEDGSHYINIVTDKDTDEDGVKDTKKLTVQVGIEGTYYTQIISDELKAGMQVEVPSATGSNSVDDLINMFGSDTGV